MRPVLSLLTSLRRRVRPLALSSATRRLAASATAADHPAQIAVDSARVEIEFCINDRPGALVDALQVFASAGVSLSHIESRQTKTRSTRAEFLVNVVGTVSSCRGSRRLLAKLPHPCVSPQPTDPKIVAVLDALRARRSVLAVRQ